MNKKNILVVIISALCITFVFTLSCFNKQQAVEISPMQISIPKNKITFMSSWGAYDTKAPCIKQLFNQIVEQDSSLEIEDASMAGEDFLFILKTDFASGSEPDIFGLWPGSDFNLLVKQGKVADLTELLKEDPKWYQSFRKETWDAVTVNGHIYGLPIEMIYEGLFINRDLFDAYDVKVPTTFEELLEAVEIFRSHNIIPIAYSQTSEGSYIYQNMVMKLGGKEDVEQPFDASGKIKPCYIEGMYYMKQLYEAGAFPKYLYSIDDKSRNELFLNKEAAMIVQGSWFIGEGAVDSNDQSVEVIPFPAMPDGKADPTAIIYGCGNGIFHLSEKAYNNPELREDCIKVLKQMTAPEHVAIFAQESGFISNVDLGIYAPEKTMMGQQGVRLVEQSRELVSAVDWCINRDVWRDVVIKEFPNMLKGQIMPETIYEEVERQHKDHE